MNAELQLTFFGDFPPPRPLQNAVGDSFTDRFRLARKIPYVVGGDVGFRVPPFEPLFVAPVRVLLTTTLFRGREGDIQTYTLPEIVAPSSGAPPERLARVPYIRDSAGAFSVRKTPFLSDPLSAQKLSPVRVPVLTENPVSAPIARSGPRRARFSTSYRAGFTNRPVTNRSQPQAACPLDSPLRPEPWQPRDTPFPR